MEIKTVFVIGAGAMGTGIAQVAAQNGYQVYLNDVKEEFVSKAVKRIERALGRQVEKQRISEADKQETLGRITPKMSLQDASGCELVIEAAAERMDVKKVIFGELDGIVKDGTILASNTSSLSITDLASVVAHPENFIGMHFFNPVPVQKLLELIPGFCTSAQTIAAAEAFGKSLGKVAIKAKDGPGFLVNRMLTLMLNEAAELLDQGCGSIEDIDAGMVYGCGHPMGPLTLLDLVGIDIALAVMDTLYTETEDSKYRSSMLMRKMVRAGYLGQKTGQGFYIYGEGGAKTPNPLLSSLA